MHLSKTFQSLKWIDVSPVAMFIVDRKKKVVAWNNACAKLTGIMAENILGKSEAWRGFHKEARAMLSDLIIDDDHDGIVREYGEVCGQSRNESGAYVAEVFMTLYGGGGLWLEMTASPVINGRGKVSHVLETIKDITWLKMAEKHAEDMQHMFDRAFEDSDVPTMIIDEQHIIRHWNKALEKLTGYSGHDLVGTSDHFKVFMSPSRVTIADQLLKNTREGKLDVPVGKYKVLPYACRPLQAEMYYKKLGDAEDVFLLQSAYPLINKEGDVIAVVETFKDLTHEKSLESEIKELKRRIHEVNIVDETSGFHTSKHFLSQLEIETSRAKRYGRDLSLIYLGIDDLVTFSAKHGSVETSKVILGLYEIIYRLFRKTDSAYRRFSDKFAIILPETGADEASILAERIRRVFEAERHLIKNQVYHLSLSSNVLSFTGNETASDFFNWTMDIPR